MKKTIGIFAHVDSGKTTFCERLLYMTGSFKSFGRTDKKTSSLDTDDSERQRGITVFSHQAEFMYKNNKYYIVDTPGHSDFFPEAERVMEILDFGVIIIGQSIRYDDVNIFRMLCKNNIPVFIFVNKTDLKTFDRDSIYGEIKSKFSSECFIAEDYESNAEFAAERDEIFFEKYIDGSYGTDDIKNTLSELINKVKIFPVMFGSALNNVGVEEFLEKFNELTYTEYNSEKSFLGKVFKIRHDKDGKEIIFIKALKGKTGIKDEFIFDGSTEKINEIRFYNGDKYKNESFAEAGDVFAVCGLKTPLCGDIIEKRGIRERKGRSFSVMESQIKINDNTDKNRIAEIFGILEKEEPSLNINKQDGDIKISITGKIQLEILKIIIKNRFGADLDFEKPRVKYTETIKESVMGIGHYEPLRHYAEVQLRLEPLPRNSGIEFESECHTDRLSINYQNLIKTHVFEKQHRGVLTGSPITDIKIVLTDGISHIKHTEGGDFRQSVYRGIRQGLMKAESVLLEPFYRFEIYAPDKYTGRIISDIQRLRGSFESPEILENNVVIKGRGPVETFMDYKEELLIFTKGEGSIEFSYGGNDVCEIAERVIEEKGYDPTADTENSPNSVFCKKGAGFVVKWYEVEDYAHTLRK